MKPQWKILLFALPGILLFGCEKDPLPKENLRIALLGKINELRLNGCICGSDTMRPAPPLSWNEALEDAAESHAADMYENGYFSHISQDGMPPAKRAALSGYTGTDVGENIARGYYSTVAVVEAWKTSEPHCKAMMDTLYKEMGAYQYIDYWVLNLGRP